MDKSLTVEFETGNTSRMDAFDALIYMIAHVGPCDYRCVPGTVKGANGENYRISRATGSVEVFSGHAMEWRGGYNLHHNAPYSAIEEES